MPVMLWNDEFTGITTRYRCAGPIYPSKNGKFSYLLHPAEMPTDTVSISEVHRKTINTVSTGINRTNNSTGNRGPLMQLQNTLELRQKAGCWILRNSKKEHVFCLESPEAARDLRISQFWLMQYKNVLSPKSGGVRRSFGLNRKNPIRWLPVKFKYSFVFARVASVQ